MGTSNNWSTGGFVVLSRQINKTGKRQKKEKRQYHIAFEFWSRIFMMSKGTQVADTLVC